MHQSSADDFNKVIFLQSSVTGQDYMDCVRPYIRSNTWVQSNTS